MHAYHGCLQLLLATVNLVIFITDKINFVIHLIVHILSAQFYLIFLLFLNNNNYVINRF